MEVNFPYFQQLSATYFQTDVFHAHELGLFCTNPLTTAIGPAPLPVRKKIKERITFMVSKKVQDTEGLQTLKVERA